MKRLLTLALSAVLVLSLPACDILEVDEGSDWTLTSAALEGATLLFTNPNPNTNIGEHGSWEYTFRSGRAEGCNAVAQYTSTGWQLLGDNVIKVNFGSQFEQYELRSSEGSIPDGNFSGTFHLTSSVPGNVVDGTFRQIQGHVYC